MRVAFNELMCAEGFDALNAARRLAIREREEWAALKKAGAGKFAKDEERMWLRRYRGACLVLGYIFEPPELGDCKPPERATGADNKNCGKLIWPDDLEDGIKWAVSHALAVTYSSAQPRIPAMSEINAARDEGMRMARERA